jgi:hypothetical protein
MIVRVAQNNALVVAAYKFECGDLMNLTSLWQHSVIQERTGADDPWMLVRGQRRRYYLSR